MSELIQFGRFLFPPPSDRSNSQCLAISDSGKNQRRFLRPSIPLNQKNQSTEPAKKTVRTTLLSRRHQRREYVRVCSVWGIAVSRVRYYDYSLFIMPSSTCRRLVLGEFQESFLPPPEEPADFRGNRRTEPPCPALAVFPFAVRNSAGTFTLALSTQYFQSNPLFPEPGGNCPGTKRSPAIL